MFLPVAPSLLPSEQQCTNGNVRLVGGSFDNEGRVEMCFNQHWGTVCSAGWDKVDASVVCRQLGFEANGKSKN